MIITRAPLRISFAGGGTDIPAFYEKETGSVVSTAINKYTYIAIHKHFGDKILLKYSQTELVDSIDDIKNTRFRECLRFTGIKKGIEISSIADVPSGTGVGSSSSFTVALLHGLHTYKRENVSAEQLAREACHIEMNVLHEPIGKQDQYAAAYGGLNYIEFFDEKVNVSPILCSKETIQKLDNNLLLFYTGIQRSAGEILNEQSKKTDHKRECLRKMKKLSEEVRDMLISGNLNEFGALIGKAWMEKRKITGKISSQLLDGYYNKAIEAGALGGKVIGAGGGGFMLFYCEREKQDKLRKALSELKELEFSIEPQGSRIIYIGD